MSHQPERAGKNCLNCGTLVAGRYCQHCGQQNVEGHMHFLALTKHFIYDIFHFDGKFFDTLRYLFFKPGFVAKEYIAGKRMKYLDPIRMYLFTSAFFFLLFFSFSTPEGLFSDEDPFLNHSQRLELAQRLWAKGASTSHDSTKRMQLAVLLDSTQRVRLVPKNSTHSEDHAVEYAGKLYVLRSEPDASASFKINNSNSWMGKRIGSKLEALRHKYRYNPMEGLSELLDSFLHRLSYLLFLSLPFFALILKLLYLRKKQLYYFDHAVFTLYHYVFSFILLLFTFGAEKLQDWSHWGIFGTISTLLVLSWPLHLYFGMKQFYAQGWGRTFVKFVLLNALGLLVLVLLFCGFILFSFLSL